MFYKFTLGHNPPEATKNMCAKGEGTVGCLGFMAYQPL